MVVTDPVTFPFFHFCRPNLLQTLSWEESEGGLQHLTLCDFIWAKDNVVLVATVIRLVIDTTLWGMCISTVWSTLATTSWRLPISRFITWRWAIVCYAVELCSQEPQRRSQFHCMWLTAARFAPLLVYCWVTLWKSEGQFVCYKRNGSCCWWWLNNHVFWEGEKGISIGSWWCLVQWEAEILQRNLTVHVRNWDWQWENRWAWKNHLVLTGRGNSLAVKESHVVMEHLSEIFETVQTKRKWMEKGTWSCKTEIDLLMRWETGWKRGRGAVLCSMVRRVWWGREQGFWEQRGKVSWA